MTLEEACEIVAVKLALEGGFLYEDWPGEQLAAEYFLHCRKPEQWVKYLKLEYRNYKSIANPQHDYENCDNYYNAENYALWLVWKIMEGVA